MTKVNPETGKPILERKFYGRRKGRPLSPKRQALVDNLLPEIQVQLPKDGGKLNPNTLFADNKAQIWFEIGFGQGEHMAALARKHPEIGFVGCEPFMNGLSSLLIDIDEHDLKNIRLWPNDARDLMDGMADDCLDRCFLIHPDPWHKTRHHKRRFIQPETVATLARLLKSRAELQVATDDQPLCDHMLATITASDDFEWLAESAEDWRKMPSDWPVLTKYGQKKLAGIPAYMRFKRM